jgi:hypothetical protein
MHFPITDYQFATHQDQFPPLTEGGDSTDENLNGQSGSSVAPKHPHIPIQYHPLTDCYIV